MSRKSLPNILGLRIFTVIAVALCGYNACLERIPVNNGLGWDGVAYARAAQNLPEFLRCEMATCYSVKRVFPSAVIWSLSQLFQVQLDDTGAIQAFMLMNALSLAVALCFTLKSAELIKLDSEQRQLCAGLLLVSYPVLKMCWYYPILTDIPALALGALLTYCYLANYPTGILVSALVGAFTFPTLSVVGLLLLALPRSNVDPCPTTLSVPRSRAMLVLEHSWQAGLVCAYALLVAWLLRDAEHLHRLNSLPTADLKVARIVPSVALSALYLYALLRSTLSLPTLAWVHRSVNWPRMLVGIGALGLCQVAVASVVGKLPQGFSATEFLRNILQQSATYPLGSLTAHAHYYGPSYILLWLFRKNFKATINSLGPGIFLVLLMHALLAVGSESRQLIVGVPFAALLVAKASRLQASEVRILLLLQLAYSRFWYFINQAPFSGKIDEFPWQHYFMMQGPWMSYHSYLLQLLVSVATTALICTFLPYRHTTLENTDSGPSDAAGDGPDHSANANPHDHSGELLLR